MAVLLRDNVYQMLRQAILTCELEPGQELREQVLAEQYRVSRSPVRDSLLRLEQENLVTVLPRQGYRVNPLSAQDVQELFGLLLVIEPACAAEATRASNDAVRQLDQFRTYDGNETDYMEYLNYNRAFHSAVAELSGNRRIAAVEQTLVEECNRFVWAGLKLYGSISLLDLVKDHEAIIDAIQARDEDAAFRRAREHVLHGQKRVNAVLQSSDPTDAVTIYSRPGVEEQEADQH